MKLFKKLVAVLLPLVFLLAACAPRLTASGTVTLTVESAAPAYTVTASYGQLTHEGDVYTLSVPTLRDVMLTVSAEGYETVCVSVTVDDFLQGDTVRTAVLDTTVLREVRITLSGRTRQASVSCGGTLFTPVTEDAFLGEVTREQLMQGVVATAEDAEPCTFFFAEEDLIETFLEASLHLVKKGTKCVQLRGIDSRNAYILDDENRLLEAEYDGNGGSYVEVPRAYKGGVHVRYYDNALPCDVFAYDLPDSEDPYGGVSFGSAPAAGRDEDFTAYYFDRFDLEDIALGCGILTEETLEFGVLPYLWMETDSTLCLVRDNPAGSPNGTYDSQYLVYVPREEKLLRLILGVPFGRHAVLTLKEGADTSSIRAEFLEVAMESPLPTDSLLLEVRDAVTGEPYTGNILLDGQLAASAARPFAWREEYFGFVYTGAYTSGITAEDGCDILPAALVFTKRDGKLYMVLHYMAKLSYRVYLTQNGAPMSGLSVYEKHSGDEFSLYFLEIAPGLYEGEGHSYDRLTVVFPDGSEREILACGDNWKRAGHDFTLTCDLGTPICLLFNVMYSGKMYAPVLSEIESVELLAGDCEFALPENGISTLYNGSYQLLLRAAYGEKVRLRVQIVLTERTGAAYRETRIIEIDTRESYDSIVSGGGNIIALATCPTE